MANQQGNTITTQDILLNNEEREEENYTHVPCEARYNEVIREVVASLGTIE